jgi:hypothetical protein
MNDWMIRIRHIRFWMSCGSPSVLWTSRLWSSKTALPIMTRESGGALVYAFPCKSSGYIAKPHFFVAIGSVPPVDIVKGGKTLITTPGMLRLTDDYVHYCHEKQYAKENHDRLNEPRTP